MDRVLLIMAALLLYGNIYAVGTDIDAMAQGSNSANTIMNNIVVTLNEKQLVSSDYQYAFFGNISDIDVIVPQRFFFSVFDELLNVQFFSVPFFVVTSFDCFFCAFFAVVQNESVAH